MRQQEFKNFKPRSRQILLSVFVISVTSLNNSTLEKFNWAGNDCKDSKLLTLSKITTKLMQNENTRDLLLKIIDWC